MEQTNLYSRERVRNDSGRKSVGLVTCPNCRVVMARISLKGPEDDALHEAAYRCPQCGAETRRWIKL